MSDKNSVELNMDITLTMQDIAHIKAALVCGLANAHAAITHTLEHAREDHAGVTVRTEVEGNR
jgi:hypothetical protein